MALVTLYSKPDCSLCDEARAVIERVRRRHPFELEEVDISTDETLLARYRERIPLVRLDGSITFEYEVDEDQLQRMLASASEAPT